MGRTISVNDRTEKISAVAANPTSSLTFRSTIVAVFALVALNEIRNANNWSCLPAFP